MPHAMFVKGQFVAGRHDEAMKSLNDNIVPMVKQAPGFISGTWFGDQSVGYGLVLFSDEAHARQALGMVKPGSDGPIQIEHVAVYEVHAKS